MTAIEVVPVKLTRTWTYHPKGRLLPNALCDWASGPKVFKTPKRAVEYAEDLGFSIANKQWIWNL